MKKAFFIIIFLHILFGQDINDLNKLAEAKQAEFQDLEAFKLYQKIILLDSMHLKANIESSVLLCQIGHKEQDEEKKEFHFKKAILFAKRAVIIDSTSYRAHLSLARSYGRLAQISSAKEKLKLSVKVKKHAEETIKHNPNEDIAHHILGKWHYTIADLSWIEKAVANTVLGGVPDGASFINAKKAFEKAVSINPNSISHNLELARTLIELDKEKEATKILEKTILLKATISIDQEYLTEANEMLKDLN